MERNSSSYVIIILEEEKIYRIFLIRKKTLKSIQTTVKYFNF